MIIIRRSDGTPYRAPEPCKVCTGCGKVKPFSAYYKHKHGRHGLAPKCKVCHKQETAKAHAKRKAMYPELVKAQKRASSKKYNEKNLEIVRARGRVYARLRLLKNPGLKRAMHLKFNYGITVAEWDALFDAQGRRCAICKSEKPYRKNGIWNTDHDHVTGKVRGILCSHCNRMLGGAYDDPSILRQAITYLSEKSL